MVKNGVIGLDIGSTTVKSVLLDNGKIVKTIYKRHFSRVRETALEEIKELFSEIEGDVKLAITGSAGLGLASAAGLSFVQEVFAASLAVKDLYPDADCAVELGGEDAKILFMTGGAEQRMNGSCAGGTGAFIDQMATLLKVTPAELDKLALNAEHIYPIASRCGVFAKSDIQPLLNQGAKREDIAASIFQAVVDQTVAGLAQGREIKGKVLFLGGPLFFYEGLKKAFVNTLKLSESEAVFPELAPCFMAYGSALYAKENADFMSRQEIIKRLTEAKSESFRKAKRPLFNSEEEYNEFIRRHSQADIKKGDISKYEGNAYLGIDAGSTTTKLVLIGEDKQLLYSYYTVNSGKPLDVVVGQLKRIYELAGKRIKIVCSAVTGYGEDLIKNALKLDYGLVETMAHFLAAAEFCPDVDFIIDIGGQDIKCFKIKNGTIDSIMLNEACSSGCGSFIQTFANAMGDEVSVFSQKGLFAESPVELGSRCTVFMNSSVKQAQKDGATVNDISAGISVSVIKNAIYKVIRAKSPEELGKNIVVQGGTFLNDAVLRAFELELGRNVIRPSVAGLMGAFGCALYARKKNKSQSSLITDEELKNFSYSSTNANCGRCTAKCALNIIRFSDGRKFVSGNRCERGAGKSKEDTLPNIYEYKYSLLLSGVKNDNKKPVARVGFPLCLNFYEQLPFWNTVFNELGFETVISDESTRAMYTLGQHTIPSDTVCYPAKISHGHILNLLTKNVDMIFYPCESYNLDEGQADNHYNCPVVAYYPELLKANIKELSQTDFIYPYIDLNREESIYVSLSDSLKKYKIKRKQIVNAVEKGFCALNSYKEKIRNKGREIIEFARKNNKPIAVLAGRPYHIDPEINHGVEKLIASLGMAVISEDAVAHLADTPKLNVLNQWSYHSRLYRAAKYVTTQKDMQLIQLVSFGCGIDAITSDEVRSILEENGKIYTQLKIDEISNLGAVKIRLRSLLAAING